MFVAGLFLFGSGQASNLLARYAATDLADPEHRGRAMSRVVFASTFGAVFGPLLIAPAQRAGEEWFGFDRYTGPWLFSAVCFALAMINTAVRLRPDPLVVAGGGAMAAGAASPPIRHAVRVIGAAPRARLALGSMAVSQAAMVAVMTMTPVHMKLHGHEAMSPYVISAHIGGMFAFSPLVGRYVDRRGSLSVGAGRGGDPRRGDVAGLDGGHHRSGCCSRRCGRSGWAGTSVCSAGRHCSSSRSFRPSASRCRGRPT